MRIESVHPFRDITNKQTNRQTDRQAGKRGKGENVVVVLRLRGVGVSMASFLISLILREREEEKGECVGLGQRGVRLG